jgi:prepilin-type N-terminal cleavage/methylation domain-containing protein/prepilin-type processing-associated H-X9-DG protein
MNANHQTKFKSVPVRRHNRDGAFTLTELLVVLATLGILAVVLLPALAGNQPGASKAFQCLNNMRQLGLACSLYANDNRDKLPTNADRNNTPPAYQNWICPAIGGSIPVLDWSVNQANTNTFYLTFDGLVLGQRSTALIGSYVAKSVNIFVCPADNYLSIYQQQIFARAGWSHRIRSCSMNGAFGDGSKWYGLNANGSPNGGHTGIWTTFYEAKKLTDIHSPSPSDCFLILDEHPNSNDDATFYVAPSLANGSGTAFTELPGSMHNNAAGMVFADGHSAMHVWNGRKTTQPVNTSLGPGFYLQNVNVSGDAASQNDLTWLAQHTPAN